MLLLFFSVGFILFCFMIVDIKMFYGSSGMEDFVLQKGLEFELLFSYEFEECIEMCVIFCMVVNVEWGNGDLFDVQVDDLSKVMELMENFELVVDGINFVEVGELYFFLSYNNEYFFLKFEDFEQL